MEQVKLAVPGAVQVRETIVGRTLVLPTYYVKQFPSLFRFLDKAHAGQWGLEMATLEEVFIRITNEADNRAKAAEVEEGAVCPSGHTLFRGRGGGGVFCDECERNIGRKSQKACCRACDYDICERCLGGDKEKNTNKNAAKKKTNAKAMQVSPVAEAKTGLGVDGQPFPCPGVACNAMIPIDDLQSLQFAITCVDCHACFTPSDLNQHNGATSEESNRSVGGGGAVERVAGGEGAMVAHGSSEAKEASIDVDIEKSGGGQVTSSSSSSSSSSPSSSSSSSRHTRPTIEANPNLCSQIIALFKFTKKIRGPDLIGSFATTLMYGAGVVGFLLMSREAWQSVYKRPASMPTTVTAAYGYGLDIGANFTLGSLQYGEGSDNLTALLQRVQSEPLLRGAVYLDTMAVRSNIRSGPREAIALGQLPNATIYYRGMSKNHV